MMTKGTNTFAPNPIVITCDHQLGQSNLVCEFLYGNRLCCPERFERRTKSGRVSLELHEHNRTCKLLGA